MRLLLLLSVFLLARPVFAQDCDVFDLTIQTGDCNNDGTYHAWINFEAQNPGNNFFEVWANDQYIGVFPLSQLPLHIENFPANNNGPNDLVKVCINDHPDCCQILEFPAPECEGPTPCEIFDLNVEVGDCNEDGTYQVWLNFDVQNPGSDHFSVWGNNQLIGNFLLSQLPLHIEHFPGDNNGPNDLIKVCIGPNTNSAASICCRIKEFPAPECEGPAPCEIFDLNVEVGDCNDDGTYHVWINFDVQNPGSDYFTVLGNGQSLGTFPLSALPLHIEHFPSSNSANAYVKVCIAPTSNAANICCRIKEFPSPECEGPQPCEIFDLNVETGDCNDDGTYHLWLNFDVQNPGSDHFTVWGNNQLIGNFLLSQLPLHIEHFPANNNGPNDVIKVCIGPTTNSAAVICCRTKEFPAPECEGSGDCNISNIAVEVGDCNDDGTYNLWLNFDVENPSDDQFDLWANSSTFLGTFNLSELPLHIEHFPTDGGATDRVKICINDNPGCCKTKNFAPPVCPNDEECKIWKLKVTTTPCVCGQFFALLTFRYKNVGNEGFDVRGNGQNYGNFPYSSTQPIVIGPLAGDGVTNYAFVVEDHNNPECYDEVQLGKVDCEPEHPVVQKVKKQDFAALSLAPNPATDRVQVSIVNTTGARIGAARVEIFRADGQLLRTETTADGATFSLDVAKLPAGVYRVRVVSDSGAFAGDFVKQ